MLPAEIGNKATAHKMKLEIPSFPPLADVLLQGSSHISSERSELDGWFKSLGFKVSEL